MTAEIIFCVPEQGQQRHSVCRSGGSVQQTLRQAYHAKARVTSARHADVHLGDTASSICRIGLTLAVKISLIRYLMQDE